MAKLFFIIAALAVFQCVAAEETTETIKSASTIVKSFAPRFVGEYIDVAEDFIGTLPPAEKVDKIIKQTLNLGQVISALVGPLKQVLDQGTIVAPEVLKKAANAAVACFVNTIAEEAKNPEYSTLISRASGIASTAQDVIAQGTGIVAEVDTILEPIVGKAY